VITTPSTVCRAVPVAPKLPQNLPTAPDASLLAILGVLRRPQVPADIPPASRIPNPIIQDIEVSYERLLTTTPHGDRYFLIPGFFAPPSIPSQCNPPLSPKQRHKQRQIEQQLRRHPRFTLLISQIGHNGLSASGSGAPSTAAAIMAGAATGGGFGISGANGPYETEFGTIDGLVPDGVVSVTLRYRRRAERTVPVANNFFVLSVQRRIKRPKVHLPRHGLPDPSILPPRFPSESGVLGAIAPIEIAWRDEQGNVIKTIKQPAYCAAKHGAAQQRCFKALAKIR
jgi:hypothetical protein